MYIHPTTITFDPLGRALRDAPHIMIAAGRLAGATRPEPILNGLIATPHLAATPGSLPTDMFDLIKMRDRAQDPLVQRLQALNTLLLQGEPELAQVGCVTALEWFLNQRFPDLIVTKNDGQRRLAQLSRFLKSKYASLVDPADRYQLEQLITRRNSIVHGEPPGRSQYADREQQMCQSRDTLFLVLRLYKAINVATRAR